MLEMLNPTPLDVVRFAAQTLSFRHHVQRVYKSNPAEAYRQVAERFCTRPNLRVARPRWSGCARMANGFSDGRKLTGTTSSQSSPALSVMPSVHRFSIAVNPSNVINGNFQNFPEKNRVDACCCVTVGRVTHLILPHSLRPLLMPVGK
jgi:hypothetical protein